jgi:pimeloyl-ACP methyl ester carboxylesterase
VSHAVGRVDKTFIGLPSPISERAGAGGHPCQGLLHQRAGDSSPTVAVIATHYNVDFSEHYLAPLLAERGVAFLGWNTRYRGDEIHFLLDHALVEIGVGVSFLRQQGFDKIVLLGNSGGASLMSAYQSQAVEPNVEPVAGMHPARGLDTLLPADGYISLAAHPGRPDCLTARLDAALIDETDPAGIDSELDLWNPENGPPYSDEFLARYRTAQLARNNRITQWAKSELSRLKSAGVSDRVFAVSRSWADPRMIDPTIEPSDRRPNSSIGGDPRRANSSVWGLGVASTLRSWLSMWSMETSQCRAEPHLARVTVPSLVLHATADPGVYRSDASRIYEAIGSTDKTYVEVNGDHYLLQPEGTRDKVADIIVEWITSRFGSR